MGRSPEKQLYYSQAQDDLDAYLTSHGFSVTAKPAQGSDAGSQFESQRDTWYHGSYRGSPTLYIRVRRPTSNMAGLDVCVDWRAEGSARHVDSVKALADALRADLDAWWQQYQEKNPRPGFKIAPKQAEKQGG